MKPIDFVLGAIGLCLGTAAALFPWHVYLNPESYGPPEMSFSRDGVIPADEITAQYQGAPLYRFEPGRYSLKDRAKLDLDAVTTGNVDPGSRALSDPDQPFPGNGRPFKVYAVNGNRVLVGDSDGIYLVTREARLPDGTMLKTIGRDDTGWHIVTSDGRIMRPQ